jgi:hypothetical protein
MTIRGGYMKEIKLIVIFIVIIGAVMPAFAEDLPPRPGDGDPIENYLMPHILSMEEDQDVIDFINMYGISDYEIAYINDSYKFIYIIPKENHSKKLVFLERTGGIDEKWKREIVWVRQIGMNETIPFEPAGPLDDFFAAHPEAEDNDTIISFIDSHDPRKWKEIPTDMNQTSSLVYLVANRDVFRELMFMEQKGNIRWVKTFNELQVSVDKEQALHIAAKEMNSSVSPIDIHVVFRDSHPFWVVTYITGPTATTFYIDTTDGEVYYYLKDAETDEPGQSSYKVPGFSGMFTLIAFGVSLWIARERGKS